VSGQLGVELDGSELEEIVEDLDDNKDGKISLEEFKAWWKAGRQGKKGLMKKLAFLNAKAIGLTQGASLELLRELESDPQYIESNVNVSVGNPGSDGIGLRV